MSKFKWLLSLVAILLVVTVVFAKNNSINPKKSLAFKWYIYQGSDLPGESIQTNYIAYTGTGEPQDCGGDEMRCAVYAEEQIVGGTSRPNLSNIDNAKTKFQPLPE